MDILKIASLTIIFMVNGILLLSMTLGCRQIQDKTSKMGLAFLRTCVIMDVLAIAGGVLLW